MLKKYIHNELPATVLVSITFLLFIILSSYDILIAIISVALISAVG